MNFAGTSKWSFSLGLVMCMIPGQAPADMADMVQVHPAPPPPTGTEPIIQYERGPFEASIGGYLRLDLERALDAQVLLATRGTIFPLMNMSYELELWLPQVSSGELGLRQASFAMQLASTPIFGAIHLGVMPVPFGLDGERLLPDRPLLFQTPVIRTIGFGSQPGLLYRFDQRDDWLSLLVDIGSFNELEKGLIRNTTIVSRVELSPWGEVRGYRSLRLGLSGSWTDEALDRRLHLLAYGHFRYERILIEGELLHGRHRRGADSDVPVRAWHALSAYDLLPQFLQLLAVIGSQTGFGARGGGASPSIVEDDRDKYFVGSGLRMYILRRRLVLSLQWKGMSFSPQLPFDDSRVLAAFDLRF